MSYKRVKVDNSKSDHYGERGTIINEPQPPNYKAQVRLDSGEDIEVSMFDLLWVQLVPEDLSLINKGLYDENLCNW